MSVEFILVTGDNVSGAAWVLFIVIHNISTDSTDEAAVVTCFVAIFPAMIAAAEIGEKFVSEDDAEIDGHAIGPFFVGWSDGTLVVLAFEVEGEIE